ncbi:MAG: uncharacterized protein KVP18_002170 [Porospora cf. gigantea A]|uniref:uncharacterized protein n=1 Tax=Porospora cf. gigantea A TaxID=2853593 RepID=UPI00355ACAEB|nr:MAG: hypothetical protein KVP18_002170 [Porospora cf. gigantea A]
MVCKGSSIEARFDMWRERFTVSVEKSLEIRDAFYGELEKGLAIHKQEPTADYDRSKCSLYMLDCCVDKLPNGSERGVYYAVDLGGTNLRAVRVELKGKGEYDMAQVKDNIRNDQVTEALPKGLLDKNATATQLFDGITERVIRLREEQKDPKDRFIPVGMTFSFGIKQLRLDSAVLLGWSKEFETGMNSTDPVIGQDVCRLLTEAFRRNGTNCATVASLNDTTGTMLAACYEKPRKAPPCMMGMILGTGFNICYVDDMAPEFGYDGRVVNIESGNFNLCLPRTSVDLEVDFESGCMGAQQNEKMISGLYICEIIRYLLLRVFQKQAPDEAWTKNSLPTDACAKVFNDDSVGYVVTKGVMKQHWDWEVADEGHLRIIYKLISAVFQRSAVLAAICVAAIAKKTRRLQPAMGGLTLGVDGSLFCMNPKYQKHLQKHLRKMLGDDLAGLIHFTITSDGSGKGAAVMACAAVK